MASSKEYTNEKLNYYRICYLTNDIIISKFGSWSSFNMLVLGSQCFYFIDRVIYVTDNFSPSELICYLQD